MSGILGEVGTPCPSRSSNGHDTFDRLWQDGLDACDDTANLDFTTEIKAPVLTKAKPKRRAGAVSSFQIHDDSGECPAPSMNRPRTTLGASNRKSSLLTQPAQRFRPKVSFATTPSSTNPRHLGQSDSQNKSAETDAMKNKKLLMQINGKERGLEQDAALKKDVRRETVYIPTEDTTVASVFMGLFSPLKSQTTNTINCQIPKDPEIDSLEARIARKRHAKKTMAGSARKTPLQPSTKIAQEGAIRVDIAGKNGGKENTPPGSVLVDGKDKSSKRDMPVFEPPKSKAVGNILKSGGNRADGLCTATRPRPRMRAALGDKSNTSPAAANKSQRKDIVKPKPADQERTRSNALKPTTLNSLNRPKNTMPPKLAVSSIKAKKLNEQFPLLTENISNPALYEDSWLAHQEVVITQSLNELFEQTDGHASSDNPATLRRELLGHYQNDPFTLLYRRVQASLMSGAMSIPKNVFARESQLRQDLGLKRRLLDTWTKTYDLRALRAALETVIGRRIANDDDDGRLYTTTSKGKILKKRIESFLEAFLLRNEDMVQRAEAPCKEADAAGRAYRRTTLRSIMIIVLLDKARMCSGTILPRRLFVTSSPLKSSAAVLQALARLLLPTSGDIIKSLGHLDCQVSYEQQQIEEYDYHIKNLAVDVRDGVRLTRIAELLLNCYGHFDGEPTTTVTLPDGGAFSHLNEEQWSLLPHLKLPCMSRVVKLYNVQVALNALASNSGTNVLIHDVAAEDIVDGHREKTIALLWRLVSKWGLPGLVDWKDVRQEIGRLKRKAISRFGYEQATDAESDEPSDEYVLLLKQWVSLLAQLKGAHMDNFSTSFADGRIYEGILDEYQGYILGQDAERSEGDTMASRLQALGCSSQFATLVTPTSTATSPIVNSDFTLSAVAFLCSRLLSASKGARAATVVQ